MEIFPPPGESQVCKWRAEVLGESWHLSAFTEEQKGALWLNLPTFLEGKTSENIVQAASQSFSTFVISPSSFCAGAGRALADAKCDLSHWVIVAPCGGWAFAVLWFLVTWCRVHTHTTVVSWGFKCLYLCHALVFTVCYESLMPAGNTYPLLVIFITML